MNNFRFKLVNAFILNIFTAGTLCFVAQLLTILRGQLQIFNFVRFGINFSVAYPCAILMALVIPAQSFGQWTSRKLGLCSGLSLAIIMTLCNNLIYTTILSAIMTCLNVAVLEHQSASVCFASWKSNYLPMFLISCVVSFIVRPPIMKLTEIIVASENQSIKNSG